jgi:hypothetical protein
MREKVIGGGRKVKVRRRRTMREKFFGHFGLAQPFGRS